MFSILIMLISCRGMKNTYRPIPEDNEKGSFITVRDGLKIFVYEFVPETEFKTTIYVISGITGINHNSEKDIIEVLSNNGNRVVVIHPRGTGYSEGKRGDGPDLSDMIADYPLLMLYGDNDMIVDTTGCDEVYSAWKDPDKNYEIIKGGSHGKSTVLKGAEVIMTWAGSL